MKTLLKTPVSYYGGKQQLLPKILPCIPRHRIYSEPFFGGGSVFFAKEPAEIEMINDINSQVVNFYKVAKRNFKKLKDEIDVTLYSEEQYLQAKEIYHNAPDAEKDTVLRAWSLFVLSHQTFLHIIDNSWAFSRGKNVAVTFQNKKEMFDRRYVKRLERTQIFCRDALRVITNADAPETFHFVDPPYIDTNCGHYEGYTEDDFKSLLNALEKVEGKFLLTTFSTEILDKYVDKNGWYQIKFEMHKSASGKAGEKKVEVFTMNYELPEEIINSLRGC